MDAQWTPTLPPRTTSGCLDIQIRVSAWLPYLVLEGFLFFLKSKGSVQVIQAPSNPVAR